MNTHDSGSNKPRVAVVFGGRSAEHGVSCMTAREVMAAIDTERFDVVAIGIATDGRWMLESREPDRFAITDGTLPAVADTGKEVALTDGSAGPVDVVFPLLHGPWGEDGTLQGMLELAEVRYVGAGVLASAVGMDKHYMKVVFANAGLPQLPYVVVRPRDWDNDKSAVRESVAALDLPVFCKPARAGSSFGITRVTDLNDLDDAIEQARRFDPKVIIESAAGAGSREIECGVLQGLDGAEAQASVVGEIRVAEDSGHAFYDFEAKYIDGGGELDVPADLPTHVVDQVREWAVTAFEALGCEGLARVDFFLRADGTVVLNEINTMPGFTPTSMFPMLWAESGLAYPELVDRLLTLALKRPTGLR